MSFTKESVAAPGRLRMLDAWISYAARGVKIGRGIAQRIDQCVGGAIRDLARLRKRYGRGRWRKMKGVATIRLANGRVRRAELHWYEAPGIGRREFKRKRYVRED
jgi:hypothetical protein